MDWDLEVATLLCINGYRKLNEKTNNLKDMVLYSREL